MEKLLYFTRNENGRDLIQITKKQALEFLANGIDVQVSAQIDGNSSLQDIQKQVYNNFPHSNGYYCFHIVVQNQITFFIKQVQVPENVEDSAITASM